jgi:hypothetical protein
MNRKLAQISCLLLTLLFLVGCSSAPAQPKVDGPLDAGDGLMIKVVEHKSVEEINSFVSDSKSEVRKPKAGNTFYSVSAELELAQGSRTMPLNLDNMILVSEDNARTPAFTLTYRRNLERDLPELVFFSLGGDGKSLDFGLGFTGMDMTMQIQYQDGAGKLTQYHGPSPIILSFLFEIPQTSKVKAFQFNDLAEMPLE